MSRRHIAISIAAAVAATALPALALIGLNDRMASTISFQSAGEPEQNSEFMRRFVAGIPARHDQGLVHRDESAAWHPQAAENDRTPPGGQP